MMSESVYENSETPEKERMERHDTSRRQNNMRGTEFNNEIIILLSKIYVYIKSWAKD